MLARRHAVLVATVTDPDLVRLMRTPPIEPTDVYATTAALDLLDSRALAAQRLRRAGARVVEASPDALLGCLRGRLPADQDDAAV